MEPFEARMQRGGVAAIEEASRFFMKKDPVHRTLRRIVARLREHEIPFAVAGGLAVVAHGYERTTVDVDLVVTREGLARAHERLVGLGYVRAFRGSRSLRDAEAGVRVEFLVTGEYPGDGKPKPVAFPDPAQCAAEQDDVPFVRLETLVEMKLASGMTNPGRVRDLADVQELIRVRRLSAAFARRLHPWVRGKFEELRRGIREDRPRP